jgi:uncharacterized protein
VPDDLILLTQKVNDALRGAVRSVECSLDLERSIVTVEVDETGWSWKGQRFPYLERANDRTIYHWTGADFQPVQRYSGSLIKLVPTQWGPPTFEIDGI